MPPPTAMPPEASLLLTRLRATSMWATAGEVLPS